MITKHYAIYDPTNGLYSAGIGYHIPRWVTIDKARFFNEISDAKLHIDSFNTLATVPYTSGMEIVEVECQYTNKVLAQKI
jgi:hypothetical protein